jgi:peptide/nickel transport system permease protein
MTEHAAQLGSEAVQTGPGERRRHSARGALGVFLANRLAVCGAVIILLITGFCFLGPLLYHTDQVHPSLINANGSPGVAGPLGSDNNGYDMLGRLMSGGRISLEVSIAVAIAVSVIGAIYGAVSGFLGGTVDTVMMRIVDIGYAIPVLFVFIFAARIFLPSKLLLIVILTAMVWFSPARLVRGEALSLRSREYVDAARIFGGSNPWIIVRHILPNAIGTVIVSATFQIADAIIALATLEFLGFGLPAPTATWGGSLAQGIQFLQNGYWWEVFPVMLIITLTVVAFNFLGDALRDLFDIKLRWRVA